MRSDLPAAVDDVIVHCERPSLVFDAARLTANAKAIATAASDANVTVLFAAKSFPHRGVREIVATHFDGFDAASEDELAELPAARIISIVDPSGRAGASARAKRLLESRRALGFQAVSGPSTRLIVGCETVDQVRAAPAGAEIAVRISASLTGRDPAIGAVQDGSGHRRSRFGLDIDPVARATALRAMIAAADGRPIGLHVHHGPVAATAGERFVATAAAMLAVAAEAELAPRFLDLGGAWHGIADLPAALREVRAAVPHDIEILIEPGRALTDGAGFACGRVVVARELDDRAIRVIDLSRICHLRWSQVEWVGRAPHPGEGRNVLFVGPTCFEEDALGEWRLEDELTEGARVIVRNVSGYAVAWNCGFHGIPPADVIIAE